MDSIDKLNINGMKEINKKLAQLTESMDSIARSLQKIEKILNRQVPQRQKLESSYDPENGMAIRLKDEEESDEYDMP